MTSLCKAAGLAVSLCMALAGPAARAAAAAPEVSAAEAARQLMDFAEAQFSNLIPGHPATQAFGPLAYRYYPATATYLAVATRSEQGYGEGEIFVMGGVFGNKPLKVGTVGQYMAPQPLRVTVTLDTNDVVADAERGVYYASVPGSVVGKGNRIATIDAVTGKVSTSDPVGSDPSLLAMAADGRSLYVALNGTGEIVRLSLPGMQVLGRTRLPSSSSAGQYIAESIAASPTEPGTLAVSMMNTEFSPRHVGVALLRDMVLQPRSIGSFTLSNQITFTAAGTELIGANTETTDRTLVRMAVLPDGVGPPRGVTSYDDPNVTRLFTMGDMIVMGNSLRNAADLSLRGFVDVEPGECRPRNAEQLLCAHRPIPGTPAVVRVDAKSLKWVDSFLLSGGATGGYGTHIVPGPGAGAALRPLTRHSGGSDKVVLIRDESLR